MALLVLAAVPLRAAAQADDEELPPGLEGEHERDYFAEPELPPDPLRLMLTVGGGLQVRIVRDLDFRQDYFGPGYVEAWGAVVLPGRGLRHGFGVSLGTNVSGDGDASIGVDPLGNVTFGLGYMPYIRFGDDWLLLPKINLLAAAGDSVSLGGEVSVAGAFLFLAGFGVYAEVGFSGWLGGPNTEASLTYHPLVTGEVGILFDYEVLP